MKIKRAFLELSAEKIYKSMIQPVFTYCGTLGLYWSRHVKVELKALNAEVRKSWRVESLIKRQSCQIVFDCLKDNVCTPFKGYFTKTELNINTRNNLVH